eukprot:SAG31_NODE_45013_length_260_cov_0.962733_1_plen_29_part_10
MGTRVAIIAEQLGTHALLMVHALLTHCVL